MKSKTTKQTILITAVCLALFYTISRLVNLTTLPIFTDEAIYIRWAQIAKQDASWRFISLTDGKQPLLIWGMMVTLKLFTDPLFAGRIVSVVTGFFSMVGIGLLGREIFKSTKIGIWSSVLYVLSPFTLVYDRMALMDSMVAMFSIWSLYLSILLVRLLRLDVALLLGMSLGGAVLTKTSGFLSIYLLPATLILFPFNKRPLKKVWLWGGLALAGITLSQIFYGVLRLSPWFHMIAQKDTTFLYPFNDWITHPFRDFMGNLHGLIDWAAGYLTIPFLVLIFVSLLFIHRQWREKLLLAVWFAAPFTALAVFGKVLYPRFILFMAMPLLVLAAWGARFLQKRLSAKPLYTVLLVIFICVYPLYVDAKVLFSIVTAPIPKADSGQYINDDPAGWGIREIVDFMNQETQKGPVTIFTEGTFGLLPYGIEIYLVNNPSITIIGLWPVPDEMNGQMVESIQKQPTYFISNKLAGLPRLWNGELLASYQKGKNPKAQLRLYKLHIQREL